MKLKPLLPYRIRNALDQRRIDHCVQRILRTEPVDATDPESADFEVHLLLRNADTLCGLVALKSLLRYPDVHAAVTITDDGSVSSSRRRLVDQHVKNVRWLPRYCTAPEIAEALAQRPQLHQLYKSDFHMIAKLLHPVLLGRCSAMVAMDADVAFFSRPDRILNWARRRDSDGMYLHDSETRNAEVPWLEQMLAEVTASRPDLFCRQKLDHAFFNAGLLCYLRSACRLDAAEHFLAWRHVNTKFNTQPFADVWLGDWTREQTAYFCMFLGMRRQPGGLGADYRIGGPPWDIFHHFLRAGLVRNDVQKRLSGLVKEFS